MSIDAVTNVTQGNNNVFSGNMMSIHNMVETLLDDCDLGIITWLHEKEEETELYKIDALFGVLIGLCNSCKDEIKKQLDYLEVSARSRLLSKL